MEKGLESLMQDVALFHALGVRVVLVHGTRPQIREAAQGEEHPPALLRGDPRHGPGHARLRARGGRGGAGAFHGAALDGRGQHTDGRRAHPGGGRQLHHRAAGRRARRRRLPLHRRGAAGRRGWDRAAALLGHPRAGQPARLLGDGGVVQPGLPRRGAGGRGGAEGRQADRAGGEPRHPRREAAPHPAAHAGGRRGHPEEEEPQHPRRPQAPGGGGARGAAGRPARAPGGPTPGRRASAGALHARGRRHAGHLGDLRGHAGRAAGGRRAALGAAPTARRRGHPGAPQPRAAGDGDRPLHRRRARRDDHRLRGARALPRRADGRALLRGHPRSLPGERSGRGAPRVHGSQGARARTEPPLRAHDPERPLLPGARLRASHRAHAPGAPAGHLRFEAAARASWSSRSRPPARRPEPRRSPASRALAGAVLVDPSRSTGTLGRCCFGWS